jgi:hypothetical protein
MQGRAKVRDAVRKRMGKPLKGRKSQERKHRDRDQARAGRRIDTEAHCAATAAACVLTRLGYVTR